MWSWFKFLQLSYNIYLTYFLSYSNENAMRHVAEANIALVSFNLQVLHFLFPVYLWNKQGRLSSIVSHLIDLLTSQVYHSRWFLVLQ